MSKTHSHPYCNCITNPQCICHGISLGMDRMAQDALIWTNLTLSDISELIHKHTSLIYLFSIMFTNVLQLYTVNRIYNWIVIIVRYTNWTLSLLSDILISSWKPRFIASHRQSSNYLAEVSFNNSAAMEYKI